MGYRRKSSSTRQATTKSATARRPQPQTASTAQAPTLHERITQAANDLLAEVQAGRSEHLERLLTFAAQFHQYSFGNQLLIAQQCPEATRVAGYKTWERLGYHVARGQHGIRILAPRPYTVGAKDSDEGETVKARAGIYFASVPVFDVSQLNPDELAAKPLPAFYHPLTDDAEAETLCERVVAAMGARGIVVEERDDLRGDAANGVQGESYGGRVTLRAGLPARNRLRTLVHEFAHELLHKGAERATLTKAVLECQAEATSYVVLAHFGIHNPFSSDYVQMWGADATTLMDSLSRVQQAAHHLITTLEGKDTAEGEALDRQAGAA